MGFKSFFSKKLLPSFFFITLILFGCSSENSSTINSQCYLRNPKCLTTKKLVKFITNKGEMVIELNGLSAPVTSGNFLDLVKRRFYEGTTFHAVIKKPSAFVIKGGSYQLDALNDDLRENKSFIDPETAQVRYIPLEIKLSNEELPKYNKIITNPNDLIRLELKHEEGVLAMARSEALDSGSSQFYIALKSLPELGGRYSIFGKIVNGLEILENIEAGDYIVKTLFLN